MKKNYMMLLILSLFFVSCRNIVITNTNFKPQINTDSSRELKQEKINQLKNNIQVIEDKANIYYLSDRDSFIKYNGYTFYIIPYIVDENGVINRLSIRFYIKVVSDKEDNFDKATFYDENKNKVLINFPNITKNYSDDGLIVTESAHGSISSTDIKVFEKFLNSKELFVIFEKDEKYTIKIPYPVRNSILDIIRQYKLLQENYY